MEISIPEDVLRFILTRIDSVPHLETLLLLWENSSTAWTEEAVATRVYVRREQAQVILQDLRRSGFIAAAPDSADRYIYDPTWDLSGILAKVSVTYRRHLVQVSTVIHSKASPAVREFARAFQFKTKE